MHWTDGCICNRSTTDYKLTEFFKKSGSRLELRCSKCNGLMGWWDEPSHAKKIMPSKREWSEDECMAMR
jgi:hypothetical protein